VILGSIALSFGERGTASHNEQIAAFSTVQRARSVLATLNGFRLNKSAEVMPALLPRREITLDTTALARLNAYFRPTDKFLALRLRTGGR
jgi:hypothetical protein